MNTSTARTDTPPARTGWTLVELAVVLATLAILYSLALTSANRSRISAQSAVSLANLQLLVQGQHEYAASNDNNLAGPNFSGARYGVTVVSPDGIIRPADELLGDTSPTTPVQNFDWISPTQGDRFDFSPNRAERTAQILELIADPRATRQLDTLFAPNVGDEDDFFNLLADRGFQQVSYLAPYTFLAYPDGEDFPRDPDTFNPIVPGIGPDEFPDAFSIFASPKQWFTGLVADLPQGYRPRLDKIQNPSIKVAVSEGTRYLTQNNTLDINIDNNISSFGGPFATNTPAVDSSTAYGRSTNGVSPDNTRLSFRYPNQSFHVARFDGSASLETAADAYTFVEWWFPTGSTFTGSGATPEALDRFNPGDILP